MTLLAQVGRHILSGNFNLTTVSLPIKCMDHRSILQAYSLVARVKNRYLNLASMPDIDPLTRFKLVITSTFSVYEPNHHWNKPLNPILGETFQAKAEDGSNLFFE